MLKMLKQDKYWVAGWLEGEGSFLKGPPSKPNLPMVTGCSIDEDVIKKVVEMIGGLSYRKQKSRKAKWNDVYSFQLKGKRAVDLMQMLLPLMSERRKGQIERALSCYAPKYYKLDEEVVRRIKLELAKKSSTQSKIAEKFGICREMVTKINTGKVWEHVKI